MWLRLNTSAGATSASIPVQRVTLFAGAGQSDIFNDGYSPL